MIAALRQWLYEVWMAFREWLGAVPALEEERPPIVWTDATGQGWRAAPDWQEAWSIDVGQHETWKIEMRVWLWRMTHDRTNTVIDYGEPSLGISPRTDPRQTGNVMPLMSEQLAQACRRLGYARLAEAAIGHGPYLLELPKGAVERYYDEHEAAVNKEAQRRDTQNRATAERWNPAMGTFTYETVEQTIDALTAGPFGGPSPRRGRDIAPLQPFVPPTPAHALAWTQYTRSKS